MTTCIHRWRIESPNGTPIVSGTCKHCGAVREFRASEGDRGYADTMTLKGSMKGGPRPGDFIYTAPSKADRAAARDVMAGVNARRPKPAPRPRRGPRTHCKYGHEYTPENTRIERDKDGNVVQRRCRACHRRYAREHAQRVAERMTA